MLTVYLSCLIVGGVFVGLSTLGAVGKDIDADADADMDVDADVDVDVDVDADVDVDVDADVDGSVGDVGHALTVTDASHGLAPRRRVWLPMLSFRFWTFGSAFFGLTGTLLSTLTGVGVVPVVLTSAVTGVGVGTMSAWMVRWLRRPVGASVLLSDYTGCDGELELPLREGGVTRIRLRVQGRERTMLAVASKPTALERGAKVLVLGIDEDGRALIEPEQNIFTTEE